MTSANRTCTVGGCEGKHYAKGLCFKHYQRLWRTGSPLGRVKYTDPCSFDGCSAQVSAKGLCLKHYMQEHYRANRERGRETRRIHYQANAAKYKERRRSMVLSLARSIPRSNTNAIAASDKLALTFIARISCDVGHARRAPTFGSSRPPSG